MNKRELIDAIASTANLKKVDARNAIDAFVTVTKKELSKGGRISVPGFLMIEKIHRDARNGINPSTGGKMIIPERDTIKVKASKSLL